MGTETRLQTHKEIAEIVDCIDTFGKHLGEWEIKFIADLTDNPPEHYSTKQRVIINRIYEEKV